MDGLPELVINIGIDESENFEYKDSGSVFFHIPNYKVRVTLNRGSNKNVTPTFSCTQCFGIVNDRTNKELVSGYYQLPIVNP